MTKPRDLTNSKIGLTSQRRSRKVRSFGQGIGEEQCVMHAITDDAFDFTRRGVPAKWKLPPQRWTDGQLDKPMRSDARTTFDLICETVAELIEHEPYEHDGDVWTRPFSGESWANMLGVNEKTFRRRINYAPLRRRVVEDKATGVKGYILRVGSERFTNYQKAQVLAKLWQRQLDGRNTSREEFGCLCGLAGLWPDPWQGRVLWYTVNRWGWFKAAVKAGIEVAAQLDHTAPAERKHLYTPDALLDRQFDVARANLPDELSVKFHRYPSLTVIRRFWYVAEELFRDGMQERDLACPDLPTWRDAPGEWHSDAWPG